MDGEIHDEVKTSEVGKGFFEVEGDKVTAAPSAPGTSHYAEPVSEDKPSGGWSAGKIILFIILALIVIYLVVGYSKRTQAQKYSKEAFRLIEAGEYDQANQQIDKMIKVNYNAPMNCTGFLMKISITEDAEAIKGYCSKAKSFCAVSGGDYQKSYEEDCDK